VYRCPDCLTELEEGPDTLRCDSCSSRYTIDNLCVDFLGNPGRTARSGLLETFFETISPIYESLYFPLLYRLGTLPDSHSAEEGARKILTPLPDEIDLALDIAAGTGRVTRILAERSNSVYSLDMSRSMLRRADEILSPVLRKRVNFSRADALNLPFGTEIFDVITCSGAIYFFPALRDFLVDVSRVIKPDGFLAGMTIVKRGIFNNSLMRKLVSMLQTIETYNIHEITAFEDELKEFGFRDFQYRLFGCVMVFCARKSGVE
jgi:ubiquinone/menaquinone biosynthesis C-methylase UbiE